MHTMTNLPKAVNDRLKELNGTAEYDYGVIFVEAPHGFKWKGPDLHCLVAPVHGYETRKELWEDVMERLEDGTIECTLETCDWCHGERG